MALTCRLHHWTAAPVLFASLGPQLHRQLTAGPTDPLTFFFGVPPGGPNMDGPVVTRAPAPGLRRVSNAGRASPRGNISLQGRRRTPCAQSAVYWAWDRNTEEPAALCAPLP
ncbi:hypothetical protein NDU88_007439 [Pleurodeles waltl]|uniref:Secreted protein n=1 Tax=Pleurodeles waltl TaxID=8319 RepID=A0AAV7N3Q2_PLEWA|nr:hypothetical protein NDU88_007439 [Pleurodeles waltl]